MPEEETTISRIDKTPMKPSWMNDYEVGASAIEEVTMSENIMNNEELQKIVEQEVTGVGNWCII